MSDDTAATVNESDGPFLFDSPVFDRETPDYLVPKMGGAISDPAYFQQLVIRDPEAPPGDLTEIDTALDPFAATSEAATPQRPLEGVLLTFEQAWRQDHLALGRLLHSLCLAPGEVTKIAVMDFSRRNAATNTAGVTQAEQIASTDDVGSAQFEVQSAVAKDLRSSSSTQFSTASQTDAAASGGGLLFSASGATSSGTAIGVASSTSASSRNVAASAAKGVQQRTVATSQAVRSRRSTQVREITESEQQTATTRVIANYNHMHALTMMFFEVIQIFKLSTRTVEAERVVFLPMREIAFTDATARQHADAILQILADSERTADAQAFGAYLRVDTIGMRKRADDLVTVFELSIGQAAQSLAYDAPITTYPPNLPQIEAFFREGEVKVADMKAAAPGDLATLERRVETLRSAWAAFRNDLQNIQAQARFENAVFKASDALERRFTGTLGPPDAAAVNAFLKDATDEVAAQKAAIKDLPRIETELAAARTAFGALQKAEAELDEILRIVRKIDTERLAFNQAMWVRTDASQYQRLVLNLSFKGTPLGNLMDPRPLSVFGTYVAFRLPHATPDGDEDFARPYTSGARSQVAEDIVALPSGGVFGEAVLGQAIAAEKIDLTRFWNWQDSPIPILPPSMQPVDLQSRARDVEFSPVAFEASLAGIIERALPDGVDAAPIVKSVTEDLRATTGGAGLSALLAAQVGAAQAGAAAAGDRTVALQKSLQDFTVGLANSELTKAATTALIPKAGGSATLLGGVLGAARPKKVAGKTP